MRVPSPTGGTVGRSKASASYLRAAVPDFSGLVNGANALGQGIAARAKKTKDEADQSARYKANESLIEFNSQAVERAQKWQKDAAPGDPTVKERIASDYRNHEEEFIKSLPPDLQDEFRVNVANIRVGIRSKTAETEEKKVAQLQRFKAVEQFSGFIDTAKNRASELQKSAAPDDPTIAQRVKQDYAGYKEEFLQTLPSDLQDEFRMRSAEIDIAISSGADDTQDKNIKTYQENLILQRQQKALKQITDDPDSLEGQKAIIDEAIKTSNFSETEKYYMLQDNAAKLEKQAYKQVTLKNKVKATGYMGELVRGSQRLADKYQLPVKDLLTIFSYETGGTFSVDQMGGKGGNYMGLIQFGPEEQRKYGVRKGMTVEEQLVAVERFLDDRGYKPGMGMKEMYSTINAGSPGRLNARDGHNGGMPGTVSDKVDYQMGGHAKNADKILGGAGGDGMPADFGQHTANGVRAAKGEYLPPDNIDEDPRFINVPFEDRGAIRSAVDQEVSGIIAAQTKQIEDARKATMDDLYNSLLDGTSDRADIDEAMKSGILSSFEERKKALGILEDREKEGLTARKANERLASGNVFDPTDSEDKKALNTLFGPAGTDAINKRDETYVQQQLLPLVGKAGALPSEAIGTLTAMSRSNDPRNMTFALQTLNALENLNPAVYAAQVNPTLRHKADLYETLVGTVPDKQLHEMLADAPTTEMRNTREFYRKEAETLFQPNNPQAVKFEDQFDDLEGGPSAPAAVVAKQEWQTLFAENYSRVGGNRQAAIDLTNKQFSRVWKKTEIDGAGTLMKHPPELYIKPLNGGFDWATKQVRGELGLVEGERVYLHSDATTAKEVAAMQDGQPVQPSWMIFTQRLDGQLVPLMAPDGRSFMRQTFKPTQEDLAAQELSLRVKSKELEIANVRKLMAPTFAGRGSMQSVPDEIVQREQQLQGELAVLTGKKNEVEAKVESNYKFPERKRADELEKQVFALMDEQLTFEGPKKDWPKRQQLFALEKELVKAQKAAEAEAAAAEKKAQE